MVLLAVVAALSLALWRVVSNSAASGPFLGSDLTAGPVVEANLAGVEQDDTMVGAVGFRDGAIAVTATATVILSDDLEEWRVAPGIGTLRSAGEVSVNGLASNGDVILAVGADAGRATVWRSRDGSEWEPLDPGDPTSDGFMDIAFDGKEFVALGEDRGMWRSSDGEEWTRQNSSGLEEHPEEYQDQSIFGFAANGQNLLALEYRELMDTNDDGDLSMYRSTDAGATWQKVGSEGLEALYDQNPNMPVLPAVVSTGDGFVLAAEGEDSEATIWGSRDGVHWGETLELGGPQMTFRDVDRVAVTDTGIVALSLHDGQLLVWRATR